MTKKDSPKRNQKEDVIDTYFLKGKEQIEAYSSLEIDILAIVVQVLPLKMVKSETTAVRQIVLVDRDLIPIMLSTWEQFATNEYETISTLQHTRPVILARRIKVSSYNGLSLSTRASTSLLINPNIPEALTLHSWSLENVQLLEDLKDKGPTATSTSPQKIMNISEMLASTNLNEVCDIQASISTVNPTQNFWYMACSNCKRTISREYGNLISCSHCLKQNPTAEPRCIIKVKLSDSTESISATLFGENAEKVFSHTAIEIMELCNEENVEAIEAYSKECEGKKFIFRVKSHHYAHDSEVQQTFNVISVFDIPIEI
ncbi:hypothetical protein HHK36_024024 [Tetracentron sinense]|uniref:Replication factor A C-terminal domain-containing protein n=1 Tax=Tetracentron sinense TaxID=13715 RepID=A0A834YP55_TETSI|nr:hypothetical protein HHK36_024024 [Tetracentron sinense]